MHRTGSTYRSLFLMTLLAALFFIPTVLPTRAAEDFIPPALRNQVSGDVGTFERTVIQHLADFDRFEKKALGFNGKANAAQLAELRNDAAALKRQLSAIQDGTSNINQKLRSANKLTADFDSFINNHFTSKSNVVSKIRNLNGAVRILTNLANDIRDQGAEIDTLLGAAGGAPQVRSARVKGIFKCAVLGARLIFKTVKGTDTADDVDQFLSAC